jgi:hypothetical protein
MPKEKDKEQTLLDILQKEDEKEDEALNMGGGGEAVASQSDNLHVGAISRGGRLALTGVKFRGVR